MEVSRDEHESCAPLFLGLGSPFGAGLFMLWESGYRGYSGRRAAGGWTAAALWVIVRPRSEYALNTRQPQHA